MKKLQRMKVVLPILLSLLASPVSGAEPASWPHLLEDLDSEISGNRLALQARLAGEQAVYDELLRLLDGVPDPGVWTSRAQVLNDFLEELEFLDGAAASGSGDGEALWTVPEDEFVQRTTAAVVRLEEVRKEAADLYEQVRHGDLDEQQRRAVDALEVLARSWVRERTKQGYEEGRKPEDVSELRADIARQLRRVWNDAGQGLRSLCEERLESMARPDLLARVCTAARDDDPQAAADAVADFATAYQDRVLEMFEEALDRETGESGALLVADWERWKTREPVEEDRFTAYLGSLRTRFHLFRSMVSHLSVPDAKPGADADAAALDQFVASLEPALRKLHGLLRKVRSENDAQEAVGDWAAALDRELPAVERPVARLLMEWLQRPARESTPAWAIRLRRSLREDWLGRLEALEEATEESRAFLDTLRTEAEEAWRRRTMALEILTGVPAHSDASTASWGVRLRAAAPPGEGGEVVFEPVLNRGNATLSLALSTGLRFPATGLVVPSGASREDLPHAVREEVRARLAGRVAEPVDSRALGEAFGGLGFGDDPAPEITYTLETGFTVRAFGECLVLAPVPTATPPCLGVERPEDLHQGIVELAVRRLEREAEALQDQIFSELGTQAADVVERGREWSRWWEKQLTERNVKITPEGALWTPDLWELDPRLAAVSLKVRLDRAGALTLEPGVDEAVVVQSASRALVPTVNHLRQEVEDVVSQLEERVQELGEETGLGVEVTRRSETPPSVVFNVAYQKENPDSVALEGVRLDTTGFDLSEARLDTAILEQALGRELHTGFVSLRVVGVRPERERVNVDVEASLRLAETGGDRWSGRFVLGLGLEAIELQTPDHVTSLLASAMSPALPYTLDLGGREARLTSLEAQGRRLFLSGRARILDDPKIHARFEARIPVGKGGRFELTMLDDPEDLLAGTVGALLGDLSLPELPGGFRVDDAEFLQEGGGLPRGLSFSVATQLWNDQLSIRVPKVLADDRGVRLGSLEGAEISTSVSPLSMGYIALHRVGGTMSPEEIRLTSEISLGDGASQNVFHVDGTFALNLVYPLRFELAGDAYLFRVLELAETRAEVRLDEGYFHSSLHIGGALSDIVAVDADVLLEQGPRLAGDASLQLFRLPVADGTFALDLGDQSVRAGASIDLLLFTSKASFHADEGFRNPALIAGNSFKIGDFKLGDVRLRIDPRAASLRFTVLGLRLGLVVPSVHNLDEGEILRLILEALLPDLDLEEMLNQILSGNLTINPFSSFGPDGGELSDGGDGNRDAGADGGEEEGKNGSSGDQDGNGKSGNGTTESGEKGAPQGSSGSLPGVGGFFAPGPEAKKPGNGGAPKPEPTPAPGTRPIAQPEGSYVFPIESNGGDGPVLYQQEWVEGRAGSREALTRLPAEKIHGRPHFQKASDDTWRQPVWFLVVGNWATMVLPRIDAERHDPPKEPCPGDEGVVYWYGGGLEGPVRYAWLDLDRIGLCRSQTKAEDARGLLFRRLVGEMPHQLETRPDRPNGPVPVDDAWFLSLEGDLSVLAVRFSDQRQYRVLVHRGEAREGVGESMLRVGVEDLELARTKGEELTRAYLLYVVESGPAHLVENPSADRVHLVGAARSDVPWSVWHDGRFVELGIVDRKALMDLVRGPGIDAEVRQVFESEAIPMLMADQTRLESLSSHGVALWEATQDDEVDLWITFDFQLCEESSQRVPLAELDRRIREACARGGVPSEPCCAPGPVTETCRASVLDLILRDPHRAFREQGLIENPSRLICY